MPPKVKMEFIFRFCEPEAPGEVTEETGSVVPHLNNNNNDNLFF